MGEVVDIRPSQEKITQIMYDILSNEVETPGTAKPLNDEELKTFMGIWSKIMADDNNGS